MAAVEDGGAIDRIESPSREHFIRNYLLQNRPVILQGVMDRWPALSRWTPEYLKSVAGDADVEVHFNETGNFRDYYVDASKRADRNMKFKELVDLLAFDPDGRQYYMTEYKLREISPKLCEDVNFADYFDPDNEPYEVMLFMGRDTCMPMHYHGKMEAFLCQVYGEKKVVLFSPEQYRAVYSRRWFQHHPLFSNLDGRQILAGDVDTDLFPKFKGAKPMEFMLHPGEMLFIPVHWWHVTGVEGYQVSLTHFFRAKLRCWRFPSPGLQTIGREIIDFCRGLTGKERQQAY